MGVRSAVGVRVKELTNAEKNKCTVERRCDTSVVEVCDADVKGGINRNYWQEWLQAVSKAAARRLAAKCVAATS